MLDISTVLDGLPFGSVNERQCSALLAKNIRRVARERRWSLNQTADFSGVSRSGLRAVLAGEYLPSLKWLLQVATAMEVEPADLLRGDEPSGMLQAAERSSGYRPKRK